MTTRGARLALLTKEHETMKTTTKTPTTKTPTTAPKSKGAPKTAPTTDELKVAEWHADETGGERWECVSNLRHVVLESMAYGRPVSIDDLDRIADVLGAAIAAIKMDDAVQQRWQKMRERLGLRPFANQPTAQE